MCIGTVDGEPQWSKTIFQLGVEVVTRTEPSDEKHRLRRFISVSKESYAGESSGTYIDWFLRTTNHTLHRINDTSDRGLEERGHLFSINDTW